MGKAEEAAVLAVVRSIPAGRVATYGQVAREAGLGRRARFVGRVMARLGGSSGVPWHRVVKAGGEIAFPNASEQYSKQRGLLEAEGVVFDGTRVDMLRCGWRASLDELLWGPPSA